MVQSDHALRPYIPTWRATAVAIALSVALTASYALLSHVHAAPAFTASATQVSAS